MLAGVGFASLEKIIFHGQFRSEIVILIEIAIEIKSEPANCNFDDDDYWEKGCRYN
jgi:hypothetical protein